jgi:D-cysteine desulfhydrase
VASTELALFRTYPALRPHLFRHDFVSVPTPVEPLPLEGVPEGALFVKRDDLSCHLYGGNKPRKLEFVVGTALARGARRLVTTGGIGTNHGLATAIAGRAAGLATTLVLLRQPLTATVRRTMLLHAAYGADLVYGANVPGVALQTARVLAAAALRGEKPFLVATGGSSTRGNVGFVSAGLELAEQVREGVLPEPEELYVAVGTGGTLAGLVVGLRFGGLRTRVVGVLVTDIMPPSPRRLARAATAVARRLRRADPAVPEFAIAPRDFELVADQVGPGYGSPTPAGREAVAVAAGELPLETTYTGKCLAAILQRAREGRLPRGPVVFWNTYNSVDVEALAPRPLDPRALPPPFLRLLERPDGDVP